MTTLGEKRRLSLKDAVVGACTVGVKSVVVVLKRLNRFVSCKIKRYVAGGGSLSSGEEVANKQGKPY